MAVMATYTYRMGADRLRLALLLGLRRGYRGWWLALTRSPEDILGG